MIEKTKDANFLFCYPESKIQLWNFLENIAAYAKAGYEVKYHPFYEFETKKIFLTALVYRTKYDESMDVSETEQEEVESKEEDDEFIDDSGDILYGLLSSD